MNGILGRWYVQEALMGSGRIRQAYGLINYGELKYSERSTFSLISTPGGFTLLCCLSYGSRNRNLLCGQAEPAVWDIFQPAALQTVTSTDCNQPPEMGVDSEICHLFSIFFFLFLTSAPPCWDPTELHQRLQSIRSWVHVGTSSAQSTDLGPSQLPVMSLRVNPSCYLSNIPLGFSQHSHLLLNDCVTMMTPLFILTKFLYLF